MSTFETSIYTGGNTPASNLQESQGSNVDQGLLREDGETNQVVSF